jgi:hypothetical protein
VPDESGEASGGIVPRARPVLCSGVAGGKPGFVGIVSGVAGAKPGFVGVVCVTPVPFVGAVVIEFAAMTHVPDIINPTTVKPMEVSFIWHFLHHVHYTSQRAPSKNRANRSSAVTRGIVRGDTEPADRTRTPFQEFHPKQTPSLVLLRRCRPGSSKEEAMKWMLFTEYARAYSQSTWGTPVGESNDPSVVSRFGQRTTGTCIPHA